MEPCIPSFHKYLVFNTFTRAPMTPKLVSLKYSNGLVLLVVFKNGYRYSGMWAAKKKEDSIIDHLLIEIYLFCQKKVVTEESFFNSANYGDI